MIYLDHAATSFPKPPQVVEAVREYMVEVGANPGRSAYATAARGARIVFEAREALAKLFGIAESRRIVFTGNATEAINLALFGLLRPSDRVVTTSIEHNAVMRPLRYLRDTRGVDVGVVRADQEGRVDPDAVALAVDDRTKLVVINHGSNVAGTLSPLAEIREAIGDVPMLVDSAQTAGSVPINVERDGVDLLAFTGHKSLLGPQGTGGFYVRPGLEPNPLIFGGTGSSSDSDIQPAFLPDRYESGTLNAAGIAGLGAGVRLLLERGVESVRSHEMALFERLWEGLAAIDGVRLYGPSDPELRTATVSLTIDGMSPSTVAYELHRHYGIAVRAGLHCAPAAHRTIGTFPEGTVRLACGHANSVEEIDTAVGAIAKLAAKSPK